MHMRVILKQAENCRHYILPVCVALTASLLVLHATYYDPIVPSYQCSIESTGRGSGTSGSSIKYQVINGSQTGESGMTVLLWK